MKHLFHTSLEFEDTSRQNLDACNVGWFRLCTVLINFSDYLRLKHYKKAKIIKHFIHLALAYQP